MICKEFADYIKRFPDAGLIVGKDGIGVFEQVFDPFHSTCACHYPGAFERYKEKFGEGETAARLTIADILDKLLPREEYCVYFGYDFFGNDISQNYRIGRGSLIELLAHFYDRLYVQITDSERNGYILISTVKGVLTSSCKNEEVPADELRESVVMPCGN